MSHVWCINKVTTLFIKPRTWFEIWRLYWSLRRKCFCGLGRTSASLKVVKKFERFMASWADQSLHITQSRGGACESPVMIGILMFTFTCSFVLVGFLSPFCCLVSFSLCKTLYGELCFWLTFVRARLCHWCMKMTHQSVMCYREGRKEVVFFFSKYDTQKIIRKNYSFFAAQYQMIHGFHPPPDDTGPGVGDPCPVWHFKKHYKLLF